VVLEDQVVDPMELRPSVGPQEDRAETRAGRVERLGGHWEVAQGVLQKHPEVVLKMVDLGLQVDQEGRLVAPVV